MKVYFPLAVFILALLVYVPASQADSEGDITKVNSAGQMYAGGCNHSASKGCDNNTHVFETGGMASYNVSKYVRQDVKVRGFQWNYTVPPNYPESGGNQGVYSLTGEYSCSGNRSWPFKRTSGGLCWGSHTLHSVQNCEGRRNVANYSAQSPGNQVFSSNICSSGLCVVDYQPVASTQHFVIGDTGDNMAAMLPSSNGTKGFLVNNFCGGVPYWMERTSYEGDKYMVIPSKCSDYQTFINAKPAGVKIENSCHPANLLICPPPPSRPPMPPHPSCGGHPHGSSWCSGGYETLQRCVKVGMNTTCTPYSSCKGYSSCDCGRVR